MYRGCIGVIMSFDSLLNLTCTLQTNTPTVDSSGQFIESWANTLTNLACRLDPLGGGLNRMPTKVYESATHTLYLRVPSTTVVTENQRIVLGGENYTILLVRKLYADTDASHLEVILELIT